MLLSTLAQLVANLIFQIANDDLCHNRRLSLA